MTRLPKEFYRKLESITKKSKHTSSAKQIFEELIQATFNSMLESIDFHSYKVSFNPRLRRELTAYENQPELLKELGELSFIWLNAIKKSAPFADVIGSVYDEHLGQQLGQFLTPPDLAEAVAAINLAGSKENIEADLKAGEPITVGDITGCGAGSLLLAWLRAFIAQHGEENLIAVAVEGQDIDASMVQLTALQLFFGATFHGMPLGGIGVRWGNALTEPDAPYGFTAVFSPEKLVQAHQALNTHRAAHKALEEGRKRLEEQAKALVALTLKVAPLY